jgi:hypothetical protein
VRVARARGARRPPERRQARPAPGATPRVDMAAMPPCGVASLGTKQGFGPPPARRHVRDWPQMARAPGAASPRPATLWGDMPAMSPCAVAAMPPDSVAPCRGAASQRWGRRPLSRSAPPGPGGPASRLCPGEPTSPPSRATSHNWCFGNFLRPAARRRGPSPWAGPGGHPVAYSSSRSSTTPSAPAPPGSSPLSPPGPPAPSLDPLTSTVPPAGSAPT